jgi:Na+/H+-dicarboxylate symporter
MKTALRIAWQVLIGMLLGYLAGLVLCSHWAFRN